MLFDNSWSLKRMQEETESQSSMLQKRDAFVKQENNKVQNDAKQWESASQRNIQKGFKEGDKYAYGADGKYHVIDYLSWSDFSNQTKELLNNNLFKPFIEANILSFGEKNKEYKYDYLPLTQQQYYDLFKGEDTKRKTGDELVYVDFGNSLDNISLNPFTKAPIRFSNWLNKNTETIINNTPLGIITNAEIGALNSVGIISDKGADKLRKDTGLKSNVVNQSINMVTSDLSSIGKTIEQTDFFKNVESVYDKYKTYAYLVLGFLIYKEIKS